MLVSRNETVYEFSLGNAGYVGKGQEMFKSPTVHSFLIPARCRTFRSFKCQMKLLGLTLRSLTKIKVIDLLHIQSVSLLQVKYKYITPITGIKSGLVRI